MAKITELEPRKKEPGKKRYVIDYRDDTGIRRRETMPAGSTKKAADDRLLEIKNSLKNGTYVQKSKIPIFKDVAEEWLKYKKDKIRMNTWSGYEGHVDNHFEDLNHLKISRIKVKTLEKFFSNKIKDGVTLPTLRKITISLNQILKYAVRYGYISHNPMNDAERPRKGDPNLPKREKAKMRILQPSQLTALIDAVKNDKYKMIVRLAIFSGARQGEILGLKWSHVDWNNSQIKIRRTFNHGQFYDPKTETSEREIDVGPSTMSELKKWRVACPPSDDNLVFPNRAGRPINQANLLKRHFSPALTKAKLPRIRFHDLRHCFASLLIAQGENVKYIQKQLGHSSPTVTLDVYSHLMKKTNPGSAAKLEGTILGAEKQNKNESPVKGEKKTVTKL